MKLSDNEIRDITELLKIGKPLPDKYRFTLFEDNREIELIWNGKSKNTNEIVLPFQTIEHIDEPRSEKIMFMQKNLFDSLTGRQLRGWTNKLIWGDNKFILSSLKNGPLRREIENNGGIKLIYIDPPFDVGMDFNMNIEIGDEVLEKEQNVLEEIAYVDTWGKGDDSFIQMMYERLTLMKDLLSEDGSIIVHCDWRASGYIRLILDEVFGFFENQIAWKRSAIATSVDKKFRNSHDNLFFFSKSGNHKFNIQYQAYSESSKSHYNKSDEKGTYRTVPLMASGKSEGITGKPWRGIDVTSRGKNGMHWLKKPEALEKLDEEGKIFWNSKGIPELKYYSFEAKGVYVSDFWDDINVINSMAKENVGYPTQKPEKLLERIINSTTDKNDIVCDFFAGSGTTAAVAEKLERKWICSDLGKFAIHTARKRMIQIQRELKKDGKNFRAFEILNLGKYEREFFIESLSNKDDEKNELIKERKEVKFNELILRAYQANAVNGFRTLSATKQNRLVAIGPVNLPLSRLYAEEILKECIEKRITKVDILAFEFEMGLFPSIQDQASKKGVDLVLKHIPKEVFDPRAVKSGQAIFHDVAHIAVRPIYKGNSIAIELTNYSVFYTQGITSFTEENLKNGGSQIVVENGKVLKISKDKNGLVNPREILTKNWHDWIDYWSIDFDFESKKEIIQVFDQNKSETINEWTGSFIFENEWQSFRTKINRNLEMVSDFHEIPAGSRKIAIKVVDIFGNDTMKIININMSDKF